MSIREKSDAIVRVISNNVSIDIFSPYKIQSDNEGIGTGFFINNDGYIVTCAHVINTSIKNWINVPTEGKKKIAVIIHSICFDKDIAILKTVDYKNKHFCELGDSDKLNSGDVVSAIGYPLGQDRLKITKGIVSGIQDRFIQTDTPINPGNSGGPLFDEHKKIIGINTSKISSKFAENIGYATPINDFLLIYKSMIECTKLKIIKEPNIYCEIQDTSVNHCKLFKCPYPPGCVVINLINGSPLYNAGMRENDIILTFDKYKLDGNGDCDTDWSNDKVHFYDLITKYIPDHIVNVQFWSTSNKKLMSVQIKLTDDYLFNIKYCRYPFEEFKYEVIGGMVVMELTSNHIEELNESEFRLLKKIELIKYDSIKNKTKKVIFISNILQGSYISTLDDVSAGSIITNVNGNPVTTIDEFKCAIKKSFKIDDHVFTYIKLQDKVQIILDLTDEYNEEKMLSSRYKYQISDLYKIMNISK